MSERPGHRDCAHCEGWGYVVEMREGHRYVLNCADCNPCSAVDSPIRARHQAIRKWGRRSFPVVARI